MKHLFKLFMMLGIFGFFIDGGDGAGAGGDAGGGENGGESGTGSDGSEIGGVEIDGDDSVGGAGGDAGSNQGESGGESSSDSKVSELEKKIAEQEEYITQKKQEEAVENAVADIQTRHKDFDKDAVYNHLKELHESDPERAEMLNNPVGWENIWYQIRPKEVANDPTNFGRNTEPVDRSEEVFEKVANGTSSIADEANVLGKFL